MQFAEVINGKVISIQTTQPNNSWVGCGDAVTIGWLYSNNTFTPNPATTYNVQNWYWNVNDSSSQVYSSAAVAYVALTNTTYMAWLTEGNTPTTIASEAVLESLLQDQYPSGWPLTPSEQAVMAAQAALNLGIQISSVSIPAINSTYSTSPTSVANVNAVTTYILLNNTFPNNLIAMPWADINGVVKTFPSIAVFKTFATAFANYVADINIYADTGGTIGVIPSNQIAIP